MSEPAARHDHADPGPPRELTRERMLSTLVVLVAVLTFVTLPFALHYGAAFILPLIAAGIISLALAPLADWLEGKGLPNWLAALLALSAMILVLVVAGATVIQPALSLVDSLPGFIRRITERTAELSGLFGKIARMTEAIGSGLDQGNAREVVMSTRPSLLDMLMQTPAVLLQVLVTLLLAFFMIEARGRLRRQLLLERTEFTASLRAARVLRDVQVMMGTYFATTFIVACGVGVAVGFGAWAFGWQSPVMWGGLAALLNLLPYVGPLSMVLLLSLFGLAGKEPLLLSLVPAIAYISLHAVESNIITPILMGRRLAISPIAILASLLYFGWIWGVVGIFLAGPLLVVITAFLEHSGRLNVIGFLFGEPLLVPQGPASDVEAVDQPG